MSDLLNLFRHRQRDPDEDGRPSRAGTRKRPARKKKAAARKKRAARPAADEIVVSLGRKQLLYVGSGLIVLLGLSFLVGLTFGKGKGGTPAIERRTAKELWLHGRVRYLDHFGDQQPVDIQRVLRQLIDIHGVSRSRLKAFAPAPARAGALRGDYALRIGPFQSDAEARDFYERYQLDAFRAATNDYPFKRVRIGALAPPK